MRGNNKKHYKSLFWRRECFLALVRCWFFVCLGDGFVFEIILRGSWKNCWEFKDRKLVTKVSSSSKSTICLLLKSQLVKYGLNMYSCLRKLVAVLTIAVLGVKKIDLQGVNSASWCSWALSRLCRELARWLCCCQSCTCLWGGGRRKQVISCRLLHGCVPWVSWAGLSWFDWKGAREHHGSLCAVLWSLWAV